MVEPKTRPLAEKLGALLEILFRQLFAFELRDQTRPAAPESEVEAVEAVEAVEEGDDEGECFDCRSTFLVQHYPNLNPGAGPGERRQSAH